MPNPIYLDNNSTTAIHPDVVDAMTDCLREGHLNPASQHGSGRRARRILEQARERIGSILGVRQTAPDQDSVIFTSGGTEANNLAIRGLVREPGEVLVSAIEHPSALAAADELKVMGCEVVPIPVDPSGRVSASALASQLNDQTRLVCLMLGNNEIGTLQPVSEVAELCDSAGIPMHCDAVQVVGKLSVNFAKLGATTLSFSAHKFHGPRGVGGLLLKSRTNLSPLVVGGSQQLGIRPGTESVALAVGMAKALEISEINAEARNVRLAGLRDELQNGLVENCGCIVNGTEPRLPHALNVSFPGLDRQALVMALDLAGVECSTGSACTSGSSEPSHVLVAMGIESDRVESSIRFSLSTFSTPEEVVDATSRISAVVAKLRQQK